jgi:8-oxo-dGTP diphosphatase
MLNIKPSEFKFCPLCATKLRSKVEEGKARKFCPNCGWKYYPHVFQSAVAVIIKNNSVLLVKRAREPYKNTWMFPAGFLDFGEHPEETVIREVKEETGLTAKRLQFIDIIQSVDDPRAPGHLIFFYRVEASGELANSDTDENLEIKWFDIAHPPKIGWKAHKDIIKRLQQNLL